MGEAVALKKPIKTNKPTYLAIIIINMIYYYNCFNEITKLF